MGTADALRRLQAPAGPRAILGRQCCTDIWQASWEAGLDPAVETQEKTHWKLTRTIEYQVPGLRVGVRDRLPDALTMVAFETWWRDCSQGQQSSRIVPASWHARALDLPSARDKTPLSWVVMLAAARAAAAGATHNYL